MNNSTQETGVSGVLTRISSVKLKKRTSDLKSHRIRHEKLLEKLVVHLTKLTHFLVYCLYVLLHNINVTVDAIFNIARRITSFSLKFILKKLHAIQLTLVEKIPSTYLYCSVRWFILYIPDIKRRKFLDAILRNTSPRLVKHVSVMYLKTFNLTNQYSTIIQRIKRKSCVINVIKIVEKLCDFIVHLFSILLILCCFTKTMERCLKIRLQNVEAKE